MSQYPDFYVFIQINLANLKFPASKIELFACWNQRFAWFIQIKRSKSWVLGYWDVDSCSVILQLTVHTASSDSEYQDDMPYLAVWRSKSSILLVGKFRFPQFLQIKNQKFGYLDIDLDFTVLLMACLIQLLTIYFSASILR